MSDSNKLAFKGTPGPWTISKREDGFAINQFGTKGRDIDTDFNESDFSHCGVEGICTVWMSFEDQQQEANLHMISAAPEAIEFIADFMEYMQHPKAVSDIISLVDRGERILKKAYNL